MDSLEECQGCGKSGIMGFCDDCQTHNVTEPGSGIGAILAKAASKSPTKFEYSCQCTSCRTHKEMLTEDGKPWKCLKPNSVGPGGFFCSQCMFEMYYNSYLDKYCYEDETQPVFRDAAGKMQRAKEGEVEIFLADVCEVTHKSDDFIAFALLFDTYKQYCQDNKVKAKSNVEFGAELNKLGLEKRRKTESNRQFNVYSGLRLKEVA